jgi:hypothetical protein
MLPFSLATTAIAFLTLARFGLVASIAATYALNVLPPFPVVWPPNQWYSGIGFLGLAVTAAIAIAAFQFATGTRRRAETA